MKHFNLSSWAVSHPTLVLFLMIILGVAGFPLHSNWWILYPRGKSLSPIATRFLDEINRSREASAG